MKKKTMTTKSFDDLLIFGYACKIFRDDEKALHIDQGDHLIPWMGETNLKIDRYDVRAALTDIHQYEAPPGGYDDRMELLTPMEQRAEQLCEEERYYDLFNDFEEDLYKEENQKRIHTGYGQIVFNYNAEQKSTKRDTETNSDQPDEIYIPHPQFYIPNEIDIPKTTKLHAIIEKTARFIYEQGIQMEILIKAKQANNPLFDFLNQNGRLNPFYKHTLQAMKDKNYPSSDNRCSLDITSDKTDPRIGSFYQNYYSANQSKTQVPSIKYKPSADCAYTQLISKIKGVPIIPSIQDSQEKTKMESQNKQKFENMPPTVEVKKISSGLILAQYYNSDSEDEEHSEIRNEWKNIENKNSFHSESMVVKSTITSSTSIEKEVPKGILLPSPEQCVIIEKTAAYVLKNGKEFEDILRAKNDQRFAFLEYKHPYHKYYKFKVTGVVCPNPAEILNVQQIAEKLQEQKPIAPVSFSIKQKDISKSTALKKATALEHSSDEESKEIDSNYANEQVPLSEQLQRSEYHNGGDKISTIPTETDTDLSDSIIRDIILENENLDERKTERRAEDRVKDRLTQVASKKLEILSEEKQIQLERKRRAMAFLNQINGDETPFSKGENEISLTIPKASKNEKVEYASDSSDSVTFVMASSTITQIPSTKSSECDDVIEIEQKRSKSRSKHNSHSRQVSC